MYRWICQECYDKLCKEDGKEREIKSIANNKKVECYMCIGRIAEHLTSGFEEPEKKTAGRGSTSR